MLDFPGPQVVKRVISTEAIMTSRLQDLLDEARKSVPTAQEKEEQRLSLPTGTSRSRIPALRESWSPSKMSPNSIVLNIVELTTME
jgi:hypothetical protein